MASSRAVAATAGVISETGIERAWEHPLSAHHPLTSHTTVSLWHTHGPQTSVLESSSLFFLLFNYTFSSSFLFLVSLRGARQSIDRECETIERRGDAAFGG